MERFSTDEKTSKNKKNEFLLALESSDQMKSLDARLDIQDEMMKKLITKIENFEKTNLCGTEQATKKLVKQSQFKNNSTSNDAPKPPPR